ncbi:unnamed protein product [Adineta ricciae]|uniref:Uncharacterized protein n=1 Tax=Adineta ricciae TaxID=249248 RepID=A0A815DGZ5_ADIRI|nr:unnamed protein product [Adineta ricciae]
MHESDELSDFIGGVPNALILQNERSNNDQPVHPAQNLIYASIIGLGLFFIIIFICMIWLRPRKQDESIEMNTFVIVSTMTTATTTTVTTTKLESISK